MSDLIDRQAAIDALDKWLYDRDDERIPEEVIRDIPSAQPERNCEGCRFTFYAKSTEDQEE